MTDPGSQRQPGAAPTPGADPASELASIETEDELRAAVLALLGGSYDRAVENRTGLSKTTVNDLRNGRRRLTVKTLTVIVSTYDPGRRDAWLAAWHKVRANGTRTEPSATRAVPDGATLDGAPLDGGVDELAATEGPADVGSPPEPTRWRNLRLAAGSALVAAVATAALALLVVDGGDSTTSGVHAATDGEPSTAESVTPGPADVGRLAPAPGEIGPGPPPYGPGPPPYGPAGPGAAAPVGGPGPRPDGRPPPGPTPGPAVARGCFSLPLPTEADVVDGPGAAAAGLRMTEAAYSYFAAWSPSAALGGRLSGRPPEGRRVVAAAWADPATADSTPEGNPGNARFYPGDVLELSEQNCFTVPPYNLGYGGYSGITTRIYLLLVDEQSALSLPREAHQLAGLTDVDLVRRNIDVVGYFVVPAPASSDG